MIKLGDLIQEIKAVPARSGLVYWPDIRNNLRKEFKSGYKIYNNLSEPYPSIKISFYLPGENRPISDVDPKDVYNYLTFINTLNWKFDLKTDIYGKDTIYAYPLDIPRGDEKIGFTNRLGNEEFFKSYLSRLKDLGIYSGYVNKDIAWNSWIKHYPQGSFPENVQEIKAIPAYTNVDIVKTLQKPDNIKMLRSFVKNYLLNQYDVDEYKNYYYLDVIEVKPENIKNINSVTYIAPIMDTRKYQNTFYDTNNVAYINFETFPYTIFTFESNMDFTLLSPLNYDFLGIDEGDNDIVAINFDAFD